MLRRHRAAFRCSCCPPLCCWAPPPPRTRRPTTSSASSRSCPAAAAGPFGVPARNAAELTIEAINAGTLPAPYNTQGHQRLPIEIGDRRRGRRHDQAGHRVPQSGRSAQKVDAVIGYISSGDCLAIAPVADELKKLTIFFDCGTPRIFEDKSYKYLFRTGAHAHHGQRRRRALPARARPNMKKLPASTRTTPGDRIPGTTSQARCRSSSPASKIGTAQMPKLLRRAIRRRDLGAAGEKPDVVHSSFWGGDMEGFILQGKARGVFDKPQPCAHGRRAGDVPPGRADSRRHGDRRARPARRVRARQRAEQVVPRRLRNATARRRSIPSYKMAQAILGLKAAMEKAAAKQARQADGRRRHRRFRGLDLRGAERHGGHDARQGPPGGPGNGLRPLQVRRRQGRPIVDVVRYPAECVNPPEGMQEREVDQGRLQGREVLKTCMNARRSDARAGARVRRPCRSSSPILVDGTIYFSWLFIVSIGLTLIYGVMTHPQHRARQLLRARRLHGGLGDRRLFRRQLSGRRQLPGARRARHRVSGAVVGLLVERGLLRPMYGRDEIVMVLVTYAAFLLILEDVIKLIWGVDPYLAYPALCAARPRVDRRHRASPSTTWR